MNHPWSQTAAKWTPLKDSANSPEGPMEQPRDSFQRMVSPPTAGPLPACQPESVNTALLGCLGRGWWPWQRDRAVPGAETALSARQWR